MRHTVVISDIHLCEVERTDGLWMRYRQAPYSPDGDLATMLDELRCRVRGDTLELILNGDIFDFDAPRVIDGESVFHNLPRDAEHAVPTITAILADHTVFVAALGRILADGHSIVFVSGNHDAQLTLPEVRCLVLARVVDAALAAADDEDLGRRELESRVGFRAWFHRTEDGIVVEHGNQYDSYNCFRYPMAPFGRERAKIQPTMGSLCARNLTSRLGYFNPHVDDSFMLSLPGYMAHWARYYLFSKRSLVVAFAAGVVKTVGELWRRRDPGNLGRRRENVIAAARETGASLSEVSRHIRLFAPPAEDRLTIVAREFWLDRFSVAGISLVFATAWALRVHTAFGVGAMVAPALLIAYEASMPRRGLDELWRRVQGVARSVARVHRARAVVFGHTHKPEGRWEDGVFYGNTGSWSPAFADLECTRPVANGRPVVWLRNRKGALTGGLMMWTHGRFDPCNEPAPHPVNRAFGQAPGVPAHASAL